MVGAGPSLARSQETRRPSRGRVRLRRRARDAGDDGTDREQSRDQYSARGACIPPVRLTIRRGDSPWRASQRGDEPRLECEGPRPGLVGGSPVERRGTSKGFAASTLDPELGTRADGGPNSSVGIALQRQDAAPRLDDRLDRRPGSQPSRSRAFAEE